MPIRPRPRPEPAPRRTSLVQRRRPASSWPIPRYTGRQIWNKQRTDEVLLEVNDVALGHTQVMRWNPTTRWVVVSRTSHTNRWSATTPSRNPRAARMSRPQRHSPQAAPQPPSVHLQEPDPLRHLQAPDARPVRPTASPTTAADLSTTPATRAALPGATPCRRYSLAWLATRGSNGTAPPRPASLRCCTNPPSATSTLSHSPNCEPDTLTTLPGPGGPG